MNRFLLTFCCVVLLPSSRNLFLRGENIPDRDDPCQTGIYDELSEPDRAAGFETTDKAQCDKDDLYKDDAWYEFTGEAGSLMADHCVPERHCGTNAPGWLNGSNPTPEEGVVNRSVCFHWEGDCCRWKRDIQVRNCGKRVLYRLKRHLWCSYRYCGNGPAPDPCDPRYYKVLNATDRAEGFVTNETAKCDRLSPDKVALNKWYRFQGDAGEAMATTCIDTMRCGAEAPGWLREHHPSVSEGIVTREVCYHWNHKCCYYRNDIQVKNCRGFYVYKFERPPEQNLRYCGNGTGIIPAPTNASNATCNREETNPCYSGDYIKLSEPDRAQSFKTEEAECDRRDLHEEEAWYRFYGKAGKRMADECVPTRHCGTNAPGWMDGSHPTEEEGEVNRTVCFHWKNDCCNWKSDIKVRNCGQFFLYYLKNDPWGGCDYRYCGNGHEPKPTTPPITTGTIPPPHRECNVTCGKDEMWISIPKYLLKGLDAEHLRLNDVNCTATETETDFVFHTGTRECGTKIRVTKGKEGSVCYMNRVLEIPLKHHQVITRVREVEIPFSCYYSKWGVVSSAGLEVKSKKIILSKKGYGKFGLELQLYPDPHYNHAYAKEDFPVYIPLRTILYARLTVDTEDDRLDILAEDCFATPYPDPFKDVGKWQYTFIKDGCAVDDTVKYILPKEKTVEKFSLEAFKFLGDHQFVYMHCKVKICNATDEHSRCKQGCIPHHLKRRSLDMAESNDEEYHLVEGPVGRQDEEEGDASLEAGSGTDTEDINEQTNSPLVIIASAVSGAIFLVGVSLAAWSRSKRDATQSYMLLSVTDYD